MTDLPIKLPFYFEATEKNDNRGFPQVFPFRIRMNKVLGMFHQVSTKSLDDILEKAYFEGSMLAGGMNDLIIGPTRVNSALNFIKKNFIFKKGATVLEIGCGEGQIIKKLSEEGIKCVGLEPGPQILKIGSKNLKIIRDFFPSKKLRNKFDLILHFGVIEHIEDPVRFLKTQQKFLKKDGAIICGFPNFESDLRAGDISMFLHEHFNYFTKYNIAKTSQKAGLMLTKYADSAGGGLLFAKLIQSNSKKNSNYNLSLEKIFMKNLRKFKKAVVNFFKDVNQSDVAIYCPLRSMNLLYSANISDCRLVDDSPNLQNKFLPTFKNKVESFENIKRNPPKKILIYSRTFGDILKKKCLEAKELRGCEIKTVTDLLSKSA